jgi:AraC family transcriptional activator of pobA
MCKTITISDLINQFNEKVEFLVDRFEDMEEPPNIEFPHKHNFYEILWITKGKSIQKIDFKDYAISENTLFFISPGQIHLFEEWNNIEGLVILFNEEFFLQIFQDKNILFELSYLDNLYENPFLELKEVDKKAIEPIADLLYQECKNEHRAIESIQALLFVFLKRIQKLFTAQNHQMTNKYQIATFKLFKKMVDQNFPKNLSISQYASLVNVSTHQLNSIVKAISGKTTSGIIKERVILESKQLLNFSELTISQIAGQLGFEDSSYFARFFKRQIGFSPQDYRKNS